MRDEIGIPVRAGMQCLKPIEVVIGVDRDGCVLAREGRVADDRVEAGVVTFEHLGEFELPVERHDRRRAAAQFGDTRLQPILPSGPGLLDHPADTLPRVLAGSRLVGREECCNYRIADELRVSESLLGAGEDQPLLLFGRVVERAANAFALALHFGQPVAHENLQEVEPSLARLRCPSERLDLPAIETNERVAVADAMIEKAEFMIARQGREPR